MPPPTDPDEAKKHFLDVEDAERVHGPDVIAGKVSGALKDADRFDMPHVKPPLSEALERARRAGAAAMADRPAAEQNALAGVPAPVDEKAGSADVLQPMDRADPD